MLQESSDILYIAISIAVLTVSGFFSYLLYSLSKLTQESKKTVEDVNKKLDKINPVVDSATKTAESLTETIQTINNGVLKPIASLSDLIKKFRTISKIFKGEEVKIKK